MKAILAKLAVRKVVGLYITDRELTLTRVALTPLGPVEMDRKRESYNPDEIGVVLDRLLKPLLNRRKSFRIHVAIGLPARRVFFSTRPKQTTDQEMSPEVLLHEVLQSANINVDDMAVNLIQAQPDKRPVVSIVSCRRKYLSGLLTALDAIGLTPYRVEPAPCALLRVAAMRHRAPRKSKTVIRVFLGPTEALAVQVAGDLPLIWRACTLPTDEVGALAAVVSTVLSVQILGKYCGIETNADVVMIHGRPDLAPVLDTAAVREKLNTRVIYNSGPALEGEAIAFGLALGCQPTVHTFDLARTLKPRPSILDIFPWTEVGVQFAILALVTLFLSFNARGVDLKYGVVTSEIKRHSWMAKINEANLDKDKKDLTQKVEAVQKFLDTRILWTKYTEDTAEHISPNIVLKSFDGQCEMESTGAKTMVAGKSKKYFVLKMGTTISQGNSMPKEIDELLDSLRGDELLHRDFPLIEVADLKRSQKNTGAKPTVDFSVICLPKPPEPKPKAAGGAEAKKGAKK